VVLITEGGGGYCGVAALMTTVSTSFKTSAFCVVKRSCATGYYSFGHELGHLMACRHDWYVDSTNNSPYSYNKGFVSLPGDWRTIMAYNNDCSDNGDGYCSRLDYWSNPGKTYGGLAMGIAEGDPNAADNHKTLNNTAYTVANFRTHVSSPATIELTSPNGGESWVALSTHNITWTSSGTVGNVTISWRENGSSSWTRITDSTANDGTYSWTLPDASGSQYEMKIEEASDGSPSDTSDGYFAITSSGGVSSTVTVTSPNGGESVAVGSTTSIKWTSSGSVSTVKLEYSTNNGSSYSTIVSSTADDGTYNWTVPNKVSSQCLVKVTDTTDAGVTDVSDNSFSIVSATTPTISVTSPNGGETLDVGSSHTITWDSTGSVGKVKIQYSTNNGSNYSTVVSSTSNDGVYKWTVPSADSSKCLVKISEASDNDPSDTSNGTFTITTPNPPEIELSRTSFDFGAHTGGTVTGTQSILVENNGGGTLNWAASSDKTWLTVTPTSGSGSGILTLTVSPTGKPAGTYNGTVTVSDPDATNSPQTIAVTLKVYSAGSTAKPFGDFSTPVDGSTGRSSIPVTGWVVDDIEVTKVEIFNSTNYIGNAVFVEGARPDVESAFPGYPKNYQAGWGYMLLTNFLPGGGNGTYTLVAKATDAEGNTVTLGSKTITLDNAGAVKAFGAIDTPAQGGSASGNGYTNWGWALTPQPNMIPIDGSTINVWVDGVSLGNPSYNMYRSDIATKFPNYANSDGAVGLMYIDTTNYANGVHTIQWTAKDNAGNKDGIGSRYFTIQNTGNDSTPPNTTSTQATATANTSRAIVAPAQRTYNALRNLDLSTVTRDSKAVVWARKGFDLQLEPTLLSTGEDGMITVQAGELERIEVRFENPLVAPITRLPIGSTFDIKGNRFIWQPGLAFNGKYLFDFLQKDNTTNQFSKVTVKIEISAKH